MKKFFIFSLAFFLLVTGLPLGLSAGQTEVMGNTTGNTANGGHVVETDKAIYISYPGQGLCRIDKASENMELICDHDADSLNIADGYLYCRFFDANSSKYNSAINLGIYRVKLDTYEAEKLNDDFATWINVEGEWIYYIDEADRKPYKMRLDGSGRTKICDSSARCLNVIGDWIFFQNLNKGSALFKMKTDGSNLIQLSEHYSTAICINILGDYIYYLEDAPYTGLYRMKTDGTGKIKLDSSVIESLNVIGDYIYYSGKGTEISRMKTDGTEKKELVRATEDSGIEVNIANGLIFTHDYKINLDGSGQQPFPYAETSDKLIDLSPKVYEISKFALEVNGALQKLKSPVLNLNNVYLAQYNELLACLNIDSNSMDMLMNKITVGGKSNYINGKTVVFDVAPLEYKGGMYVPIKQFAEIFEATAKWDEKSRTMLITTKVEPLPKNWTYMKDRPAGNESMDITVKSPIPGIEYFRFSSNDSNKAVVIGGKIYMVDNDGTLKEYDPKSDIWKNKAVISGVKDSYGIFQLMVLNNKLLIAGANGEVLQYDLKTGKSGRLTKIPVSGANGVVVSSGKKLYALSTGDEDTNSGNLVFEYDLLSNKWKQKADMLQLGNIVCAGILNNKIYVLGIQTEKDITYNIEVYDIQINKWSYIGPMDVSWFSCAAEMLNGKLYFIPEGDINRGVVEFNPKTNVWKKVSNSPELGYGFATASTNGNIYVIAGRKVIQFTPPKK